MCIRDREKLVEASNGFADRQASGATDALAEIVQGFTDKVSEAGSRQRDLMDKATGDLQQVVQSLKGNMDGFLENLEKRTQLATDQERQFRDKLFQDFEETRINLSEGAQKQQEISQNTIEKNQEVADTLGRLAQELSSVMSDLDNYSKSVETASRDIAESGSRMEQASEALGERISGAVEAAKNLAQENAGVSAKTSELIENMNTLEEGLSGAAGHIENAANTASETFESLSESKDEFLKNLRLVMDENNEHLSSGLDKLVTSTNSYLTSYTELVQTATENRMENWNEQTRQFSESMYSAVQGMHEAIGSMNDQIEQIRKRGD